jgi:hypothetical protein
MGKAQKFAILNEIEFSDLVSGTKIGFGDYWPSPMLIPKGQSRIGVGEIGVLWIEKGVESGLFRPTAVIVHKEDQKRLFNRFSQLRSDLAPLSTWCHIFTPQIFASMKDADRSAELGAFEAAWTGLVIAEASILAARPVSQLRLPACLATQTYAIARSTALWPEMPISDVLEKFDSIHLLLKETETTGIKIRANLEPLWAVLKHAGGNNISSIRFEYRELLEAAIAITNSRSAESADTEARRLYSIFRSTYDKCDFLLNLDKLTPERRLKEFDSLIERLRDAQADQAQRNCFAFLAGYLATIAAGGAASLSLAEGVADKWPEVLAWAYVIGGIGERITWTSSFDGLGRMVARELSRTFHVNEAPHSDFSIDEARVLVDKQLSNPLVHLRIKQQRVAQAALLPGVTISIALGEQSSQESGIRTTTGSQVSAGSTSGKDVFAVLADALFPYLQARLNQGARGGVDQGYRSVEKRTGKSKSSKRDYSTSRLPLEK